MTVGKGLYGNGLFVAERIGKGSVVIEFNL